jgi:threonine dehydrogenase-like Zn-dependent dehydrogenase
MIGAIFRGPGRLEVGEIETPEIGSDEVLVKVGSNTVCGTDVRILRGEKTKGIARDVVLGHELAGHVAEVGENVQGYEVGAPVVMDPMISCRRCCFCRRGMENVCPNLRIIGNVVNGASVSTCVSSPRPSKRVTCSSREKTCLQSISRSPSRSRAALTGSKSTGWSLMRRCLSWGLVRSGCSTFSSLCSRERGS